MSFKKNNVRKAAIAGLSLTLCATLTASVALMNFENNTFAGARSTEDLAFKEVTDQFDGSELTKSNFNSSVLEGKKSGYETRTVIVYLTGDSVLECKNSGSTVAEYLETGDGLATLRNIDREQKTFLDKLSSHGIKYQLKSTYSTIANAVAIEVNTSYVKQIKNMGGVESAVIANTYLAPKTEEGGSSTVVTNKTNVYATGIYDSSDYSDLSEYPWGTGAGTVVAILDTGLDYSHDAFQSIPGTIRMQKGEVESRIKNTTAYSRYLQKNGGELTADDVYISDKVPYAYDYADDDADVYPSYSNHGTHVAGIVAGYDEGGYDDKDGNHIDEVFRGVAPDAQLVIMKTFTDDLDSLSLGGAEAENIMSALEDCVNLGVDVINMSLGSTAGFTTTDDGDDEGEKFNEIFENIRTAGISLICAASNDYSAGFGSVYGTNLASNPDSGTVGSPSTYYAALSVASISGQKSPYMQAPDGTAVFFENARNADGEEYDFVNQLLAENEDEKEYEYVVVGTGQSSDYRGVAGRLIKGRIALIKRGINTFQEKIEMAARQGAIGAIVYNNVSGSIRMSLGDVAERNRVPAVSITMDAGNTLINLAAQDTANGGVLGKITVSKTKSAGPFMSEFSSWGTTSDLKIKPEITAHGGEITSTVPGGYAEQSGTSMASPNMAGVTALVRNYVKTLPIAANYTPSQTTQLTNQLILSTATTVYNEIGLAYSPRKQGSGLASLKNIVETNAYLFTDSSNKAYIGNREVTDYWYEGKDCRPKAELGADTNKVGEYTFDFNVKNMGGSALTFTPKALFMTETLDSLELAVKEQAYMLDDIAPVFTVNGNTVTTVSVPSGETLKVTVTLKLSDAEKKYLDDSFKNGMFVEGFIKLESSIAGQCDLSLPFLSFYGDWEAAPMLDYTVYEIADFQQDTSLLPDAKPSETIWPTQAFGSYYGDQYTIPLGSYCYTIADGDDEMYANMEYCAISRFNEIVSEDGIGNYATTFNIRCLYAGLLRNARQVNYKLYDVNTGEYITGGEKYRISKAYSNGGSARPAYIELKLSAEELGLLSNGKYRMDFEFLFNKDSEVKEENTFSFEFYVDYEAPVLQDARIRYQDYKENNRDKQRIYLDLDIYDNHYAQSVMLCYVDTNSDSGIQELKLATPHATPVRNPVKNGVSTVTIEVTDIWDEYKDLLAVQIDDYALNHRSYMLGNLSGTGTGYNTENELNPGVLPDTFELAEGEENITVGINEMHKVSLVYEGDANLSNFHWSSASNFVDVKNGEIVGVRATTRPVRVSVTNRKGVSKNINVTVTNNVVSINNPKFTFGVIKNYDDGISKANGTVTVRAGADFKLDLVKDPWYIPDSSITSITYESSSPDVATVDAEGNVHTKKKGSATITATVTVNGSSSFANVVLNVHDEYLVNNMELRRYYGEGEVVDGQAGVVIIPKEKNVMTIGDEAFKDNKAITKVIIPKTVTQIGKNAFKGCTSLKEVYFIDDEAKDYTADGFVADADLTLINRHAFEGCTSLEYVDFRNVKVITLAREVFKDCVNLKKIEKSSAIGTASDHAFLGCKSLEEIDISGLHVAGAYVFAGCTSLKKVTTGRFTAIGEGMFSSVRYYYDVYNYETSAWEVQYTDHEACNSLTEFTVKSTQVGNGAFANCKGLSIVTFEGGSALEVRIGDSAFAGCEKLAAVNFGSVTVKIIGAYAFKDTALTSFTFPNGVESVGTGAFEGTQIITLDGETNGYTVTDGAVIKGGVLVAYLGEAEEYVIPATVTEIGAYAFAKSTVKRIIIPATVTAIGEGAFNESALESVTFEGNLTQIPDYAFYGTKLTAVSLPSTVESVGNFAFANTPITSFTFAPANKATFGDGVFSGCASLTQIQLNAKITVMGSYTFVGCTKLTDVTLPSLEVLGDYTFWNTPQLASVTFGAGSTVTGNFTFAAYSIEGYNYPATRTALTSVTLGSSVNTLGDGLFFNCVNLSNLTVSGVEKVGNSAFYNCNSLATPSWLAKVKEIGANAFYNCNSITELNLAEAVTIGAGAFRVVRGRSFTTLNIPKAQIVGELAFYGGSEKTVNIPSSLTRIGGGAFAGSVNLTSFTCEANHPVYFAEDGVLYRTIPNSFGSDTYGLVAYPSAKSAEAYEVKEGTARIEAYAFSGLKAKVNKVVMPYTVTNIGAFAFFDSGITVYEFNSVAAPALEEQHDMNIDIMLDTIGTNYRGFYYANFNDYIIYYSSLTTTTPANLTIRRPDNGTGYSNYVFATYFGTTELTGVVMEANTRAYTELVDSFPSSNEVSKWTTANKTKAEVEEFAERVKTAHGYYNSFSLDEAQVNLAGQERIDKLNAIEKALRSVKSAFGIQVKVTRLVAQQGSYKSSYYVGEEFDMTGLVVTVEYDDYSTEIADMSKITFVGPTGPLGIYNNEVTISGYGTTLKMRITVTEKPDDDPNHGGDPETGCGGCGSAAAAGLSLVTLAVLVVAGAIIRRRHRGNK